MAEWRYELLEDDLRFKLKKGDVLICGPMHWAWATEKLAVIRRESDGYEPECSVYRETVKRLPDTKRRGSRAGKKPKEQRG